MQRLKWIELGTILLGLSQTLLRRSSESKACIQSWTHYGYAAAHRAVERLVLQHAKRENISRPKVNLSPSRYLPEPLMLDTNPRNLQTTIEEISMEEPIAPDHRTDELKGGCSTYAEALRVISKTFFSIKFFNTL